MRVSNSPIKAVAMLVLPVLGVHYRVIEVYMEYDFKKIFDFKKQKRVLKQSKFVHDMLSCHIRESNNDKHAYHN